MLVFCECVFLSASNGILALRESAISSASWNIRINILRHYNRFNIEVSSEVDDENRRSETHNYLCAVTADNGASLYNVTNAQ